LGNPLTVISLARFSLRLSLPSFSIIMSRHPSDAFIQFVYALSSLVLPPRLEYDVPSSSTSTTSQTARRHIEPCQLSLSDHLLGDLHNLIKSHIEHVGESPSPGLITPAFAQLGEISNRFRALSRDAASEASREYVSGEYGESHFLKAYLINPLNEVLRLIFPNDRLYWRFVGTGPGGKPDIELILDPSNGLPKLEIRRLAVAEIKTIEAFSERHVSSLRTGVSFGEFIMDDGNTIYNYRTERPNSSQNQRGHPSRVLTQVSDLMEKGGDALICLGSLSVRCSHGCSPGTSCSVSPPTTTNGFSSTANHPPTESTTS